METFVWLANPATGDRWQCPEAAADAWRAKGWQDCDPPGAEPEAESEVEPAEPGTAEPSEPKTAGRKRGGETTTAPEE